MEWYLAERKKHHELVEVWFWYGEALALTILVVTIYTALWHMSLVTSNKLNCIAGTEIAFSSFTNLTNIGY